VGAMYCFAVETCGGRFYPAIGEGMTARINGLQRCPRLVVDSARGDREGGRESPELFVASILREQLVERERRTSYGMPAESSGDHTPLDKYV